MMDDYDTRYERTRETADLSRRPHPFGFDPAHVVDMRVEMASDKDTLPTDWPCEIVRRAARDLKADIEKRPITMGGATRDWQLLVAEAWEHQADDMGDHLAHLHAFGPPGNWAVEDERECVHWDWTATLRAALAYLREDAPKVPCEHEFPPPTGDPDAEGYGPGDCTRCGMTYQRYDAQFGERMAEALEGGVS